MTVDSYLGCLDFLNFAKPIINVCECTCDALRLRSQYRYICPMFVTGSRLLQRKIWGGARPGAGDV